MKDEYTPAAADDVFAKLLPMLALWAVDGEANPAAAITSVQAWVQHPFICEAGIVVCGLEPYADVAAMCRTLTQCMRHTHVQRGGTEPTRGCRMHPVVSDALLAAYAMGGPEAVVTYGIVRARPESFRSHVYEHWRRVLEVFAHAVVAYDRSLLTTDRKVLSKSKHHWMDMPTLDQESQIPVLLKVRPARRKS